MPGSRGGIAQYRAVRGVRHIRFGSKPDVTECHRFRRVRASNGCSRAIFLCGGAVLPAQLPPHLEEMRPGCWAERQIMRRRTASLNVRQSGRTAGTLDAGHPVEPIGLYAVPTSRLHRRLEMPRIDSDLLVLVKLLVPVRAQYSIPRLEWGWAHQLRQDISQRPSRSPASPGPIAGASRLFGS